MTPITPIIIMFVLHMIALAMGAYKSGQTQDGGKEAACTIIGIIFINTLLWWGNWFAPLLGN